MANQRELKALITLSGKLDPSLQRALLKATNQTRGLSTEMGLTRLAATSAMRGLKTGIITAIPSLKVLGWRFTDLRIKISTVIQKNIFLRATFVSLRRVGMLSLGALKIGLKGLLIGFTSFALIGGMALLKVGQTGLQAASDLAEVQNVVDVTFGEGSKKIDAWSKSLLKSYGLGELSAKKYTSTMGAMLKSSGIASDDMMTMSQNLTMLTGDMASFYNLKPDEMFEKLRSGISGETEPLKQLGINMSAANLEAFALSQGIEASYSSMNEADKTMLRYNYILETSKDAQGDFANTIETSLSGQQKLLAENFTQMSSQVMQNAAPALTQMMQSLNGFMTSIDTEALGSFVGKIGELAVQLLPIAMQLMPVIQNALTTLLPPLLEIIKIILPPITAFLQLIVKVAGAAITKVADIIGKIAGFFGKEQTEKRHESRKNNPDAVGLGASRLQGYARGGFARRPSIFGEAGLEAAIPIKPGNSRSLMLLQKTADLLGVGDIVAPAGRGQSLTLHYNPIITGVPTEQLQPMLKQHVQDIAAILDERANMQRRMSFGTS